MSALPFYIESEEDRETVADALEEIKRRKVAHAVGCRRETLTRDSAG
jgi:hypothetical protein